MSQKMKAIRFIATIMIAASLMACQQESYSPDVLTDGDKVEVVFQVQLPEPVPVNTRAQMGEGPTEGAFDLYLCLYGAGDGYVQNWIPAHMQSLTKDAAGYITGGVYKAYLPLTNESRIVHLIANPPAQENPTVSDYIDNVMERMVTTDKECSYWQEVVLPHIKLNAQGTGVDPTSVAPLTAGVHLVRNFAKVVVRSAGSDEADYQKFRVVQWTLLNVPDRAYVAPYTGISSARFPDGYMNIANYESGNSLYTKLTTSDRYPGYMPPEAVIDETFPGEPSAAPQAYVGNGEALYMYERPLPSSEHIQTAIIVQIEFDADHPLAVDGQPTSYWYKVEVLNQEGAYVPFLRNIVYRLKIEGLEEAGEPTALDAYNGSYFGNISASLETASLNELSNGKSQIHVDLMDYTFLQGNIPVILGKTSSDDDDAAQFYFIPDEVEGTRYSHSQEGVCTITVTQHDVEEYDPSVTSFSVSDEGVITVNLASTGTSVKKSILRVSGKAAFSGAKELYREITVNLMQKQYFKHGDDDTRLVKVPSSLSGAGKEIGIMLELPQGLGSSVFPIQVRIEAEKNSLSATSHELPVKSGVSVYDASRNTFYYIYTIKYSDYCQLNPRTKKYVYNYDFPITFYTNKTGDNSTKIDIRDLAGNFYAKELTLGTVNP